jgi:ribonuclease VapC
VIVDTSAIIAVLFNEHDARVYAEAITRADACRMSAATFVEIESVTEEHAYLARQAFIDFGKGRHRAGLNYGDCFSYALARATREPLLFKGKDFAQTDVVAAR